ncbi:hypothetical protein MPSEU_000577700 [Mayamaea pseudoterrestris]|nr:hypothetical protein MPSEU_000577700 [Mayamaea pseudoterrestris]
MLALSNIQRRKIRFADEVGNDGFPWDPLWEFVLADYCDGEDRSVATYHNDYQPWSGGVYQRSPFALNMIESNISEASLFQPPYKLAMRQNNGFYNTSMQHQHHQQEQEVASTSSSQDETDDFESVDNEDKPSRSFSQLNCFRDHLRKGDDDDDDLIVASPSMLLMLAEDERDDGNWMLLGKSRRLRVPELPPVDSTYQPSSYFDYYKASANEQYQTRDDDSAEQKSILAKLNCKSRKADMDQRQAQDLYSSFISPWLEPPALQKTRSLLQRVRGKTNGV